MKTKRISVILTALLLTFMVGAIAEAARLPKAFPEFSTSDLDGRIFTNAIFAENEITMINFWATWCPPCIAEMPDLAELAEILEKTNLEAGLIGVLLDADDRGAIRKAEQILDKAKAHFTQLRPNNEMRSILDAIDAIPTTIFVDSKGNIVGQAIVGARSSQAYLDAIFAVK